MIADGSYDVFIVDATPIDDEPGWHLELTILAGDEKGNVVSVRAAGLKGSEFDLIGMPGTLHVVDGRPSFHLD